MPHFVTPQDFCEHLRIITEKVLIACKFYLF